MKRLLLLALPALLAFLPPACSLRRGTRAVRLPRAATEALAEARELERARPAGWLEGASAAVRRAQEAAPDWVAPKRVQDDLERQALLGHEALGVRWAALGPEASAAELYLAGRLEGRGGDEHLEEAARRDPGLSWAQHGLAWLRFLSGDTRAALRAGTRARELARGSYELGFFTLAEARYRLERGDVEEAIARLEDGLADPRLDEPERTELEVALARAELESDDGTAVERGFWRAVGLLEGQRLAAGEYEELGAQLLARRTRVDQPDPLAVLLAALAQGEGEARARLRARVLSLHGAHALAGALWERAGGSSVAGPFQRARDLERGAAERALERWRAALPARVKDESGLPREPVLRALVLAARESAEEGGAERFGQALLEAGWFEEAESWATAMAARDEPGSDPSAALALGGRAAAGRALLAGVRGVLERVDEERPAFVPEKDGAREREIGDLDELLAALQPFFERFHGRALEHELRDSPRLSFGGLAAVVHPGPRFSAVDESEGRGREDTPVPGLAAELARLNRFGIFGQAPLGGGPDGTVLRLVGGEWKRGRHLGVPFAGWVAWCEGADVESRPGRVGAGVSGAALHEGYWVDVEGVRGDLERIHALEREFLVGEPSTLPAALAGRGPRLAPDARAGECARWMSPLGEGERVLLAALRERPAPPAGVGRVSLDELLELTAVHEEGHLTERTRFLPLGRKWRAALGFVLRYGVTPRALARALEYRAQLVVLCVAEEPRLALSDCLVTADAERGTLAHSEAYRELLRDLLEVAAERLGDLPALDPDHYLLYQLHWLSAEEVRGLARELARRHGMIEE
jgi:hypothetical protein